MSDIFDNTIFQLSGSRESEAEFIPLITPEEEENMNSQVYPDELPILPLRNNVLFPGVVIPITVGRDKSIKLIQDANKDSKIIGVVSQKNQEEESPEFSDLYSIGTVAQIIRMLRMPDGSTTVIIQGNTGSQRTTRNAANRNSNRSSSCIASYRSFQYFKQRGRIRW